MPVCFDPQHPWHSAPDEFRSDGHSLHIGLINNMPGAALSATERQFRTLLEGASEGIRVRLSFYALPEISRSDDELRWIRRAYSNINDLWDTHLDGLIVTGMEPSTPNLVDEPYWESLTTLLEWTDRNTHSSVWSCLAAHAAVLHIDGIQRRLLGDKLFGVFECKKICDNSLAAGMTAGIPDRMWTPHSRWNDILSDVADDALAARGYHVLARSQDAGVDTFIRQRKSLFLFFQGHPEYEVDSLLLEYRRDIRRFLRRERISYPSMPHGYFDQDGVAMLGMFEKRALSDRREALLADFPIAMLAARTENAWRPAAIRVYRNWLLYMHEQKTAAESGRPRVKVAGIEL